MQATIRRNEREAMARMEDHARAANHSPAVGTTGVCYFSGRCTVVAIDARIVTLRNSAGNLVRHVRAHWMGLKYA
jgi:hypothetical protein